VSTNRRDFLKQSVTIAGAASALISAEAEAQDPTKKPPAKKGTTPIRINPNAKAVLPDGSVKSRADILNSLGLDPSTPPDAWLAIFGCGSNASALTSSQLKDMVNRGVIKKEMLDKRSLERLQKG
jgi:hypothetical protein